MKERGKSLERKVVRGSETVGRDVKSGVKRAGRKLRSGAGTVGRDVRSMGRRMEKATKHGVNRAEDRLRPAHRGKMGSR
jgi:hypothetical protein